VRSWRGAVFKRIFPNNYHNQTRRVPPNLNKKQKGGAGISIQQNPVCRTFSKALQIQGGRPAPPPEAGIPATFEECF